MKHNSLTLLLVAAGMLLASVQTAKAQKVVLHMAGNQKAEYDVSQLDSINFVEVDSSGDNPSTDPSVTGDAIDITNKSATLVGYATSIRESLANDLRVGFIYCLEGTPNKNNGTQVTVNKNNVADDGRYMATIENLLSETTYYFRSFVYQSGLWFYGKVKSFVTAGIDVNFTTGDATDITCFSAKVSGSVNVQSTYSSLTYGICYGTGIEPTINDNVQTAAVNGNIQTTAVLGMGEGTEAYPYTVEDIRSSSLSSSEAVWMIGYMVGTAQLSMNNAVFCADTMNQSNILLSSDSLCTDTACCIPIELSSDKWRKNLSLPTNVAHFRKCLLVKGVPSQYMQRKGLRYVSAGFWLDDFDISSVTSSNNFTLQLRQLTGGTTYYYRPYAIVDGQTYYGNVQTFRTLDDNVVETGDIDEETLTVTSHLTIGGGAYSSLVLGVCYGKTELPTINDFTVTSDEVDEDNNYTVQLVNPGFGTIYYRAYVLIDGIPHYGAVKVFNGPIVNPKVRIAIYETIPGYSVRDLSFYADGTTDITQPSCVLFADANDEIFTIDFGTLNTYPLGTTSVNVTFAGNTTDNYYTSCSPNEEGIELTLRVNYTLVSSDGSGEVIHVTNASAQVPAEYTKWEYGCAYTYFFKIYDNYSGWTAGQNVSDLYPIRLDAIVVKNPDGSQQTIAAP